MIPGVGTDFPDMIVPMEQVAAIPLPLQPRNREEDEDNLVLDPVAAIDYEEKEFRDDQMDSHKQVETVDDGNFEVDWYKNVNKGEQYAETRQEDSGHACRISTQVRRGFGPS